VPPFDLPPIPADSTTRFAPSPTGYLHLGHVANAVWTWGVAQAVGARVLLRLEDHDRGRCRPEYEAALLEDLDWLGLVPDRLSRESLAGGPSSFRQSDSQARYQAALTRLAQATDVYACVCSRKAIAALLGDDAPGPGEEPRYPGTCREASLEIEVGRGVRAILPDLAVDFTDLRLGPLTQTPSAQCGDLLLKDSTGNWTYQFSVVVDDLEHGVDLIVRGDDLLESTGRQILLGQLLGRTSPPRYLHHPLILDARGVKLSKRSGAPGLRTLREDGLGAGEVLGLAARATGLTEAIGSLEPGCLGELFRVRAWER